jgi:Flp pilus assembly protein TadB
LMMVMAPRMIFVSKRSTVDRVAKMIQKGPDELAGRSFFKNVRKHGFAIALVQAGLDITPMGFYRTGAVIAAVAGLAAYVLTGGYAVAGFVAIISIMLYLNWLFWRRDNNRMLYEEGLADVADAMAAGALITNTIKGSITHAAQLAPPAVREDFQHISSMITQGASIPEAFAEPRERRQSYSLDLLADTLFIWSTRGTTIPLSQVLNPLTKTIREMSSERRRMESELMGTRYQMILVAAFPFFMVFFMRTAFPDFRDFFTTEMGQLFQLISYSISTIGYVMAERVLGGVRKVLDVQTTSDGAKDSQSSAG